MGFIFVSGIGFAALIAASATSAAAPPAGAGGSEVQIRIDALRNQRGLVHACLTRDPAHFPDCKSDPRALKLTRPAREAGTLRFEGVPSGTYAIAIVHDENGNGRLDKLVMVPREGFGFSRNPPIRFGPPRFEETAFPVTGDGTRQNIRLRYLL